MLSIKWRKQNIHTLSMKHSGSRTQLSINHILVTETWLMQRQEVVDSDSGSVSFTCCCCEFDPHVKIWTHHSEVFLQQLHLQLRTNKQTPSSFPSPFSSTAFWLHHFWPDVSFVFQKNATTVNIQTCFFVFFSTVKGRGLVCEQKPLFSVCAC